MRGIIIKNVSNDYVIKVKDNNNFNNEKIYQCKARGKFRKEGIVPLVGDVAEFDENDLCIYDILKRKNCLVRPKVANVDQAVIVTSVKEPDLDLYLLDKLLTIISYNGIEIVICFTKLDLLVGDERKNIDKIMNYYKEIGYKVVTNEKVLNFQDLFKDKITVLAGQSGAGKSSLLNLLDSRLQLKTDSISFALNRGKHTTRHTELFTVLGGYVVDTPGFSSVNFSGMDEVSIRDNMIEMFEYLDKCKYRDCMHLKEDGCFVKKMLEDGEIMPSRYDNYKAFVEETRL